MNIMNIFMTAYIAQSAARVFYIGFVYDGKLYLVVLRDTIPAAFLRVTTTSKTHVNAVRVQITSKMAQLLIKDGRAIELGDATALNYSDKYNRGEHFERYIVERYTTTTWYKDTTPWYIAGDAEINGEQVQIKFNGATVTDERKIARA